MSSYIDETRLKAIEDNERRNVYAGIGRRADVLELCAALRISRERERKLHEENVRCDRIVQAAIAVVKANRAREAIFTAQIKAKEQSAPEIAKSLLCGSAALMKYTNELKDAVDWYLAVLAAAQDAATGGAR